MADKLRDARDHISRMENRITELTTECNRLYGIGQELVEEIAALRAAGLEYLKSPPSNVPARRKFACVVTGADPNEVDTLLQDSDPPKEVKLSDTPCSP